jgi:hypothetical protein
MVFPSLQVPVLETDKAFLVLVDIYGVEGIAMRMSGVNIHH